MTARVPGSTVLAALLLAACGHSSPTRFWTLDAVAPPAAPPASPTAGMVAPVRVDAVRVPTTLDRLEVVEATGGNRVTVHDFDRWSAPPGELMRRVLTQDLVARLPAGAMVFPTAPKPPGCRSLVIDVLTLQPTGTGWVTDVAWTIAGSRTGAAPLRRGQLRLTVSGPATPAGQAAAVSALIGQLADALVPAIGVGGAQDGRDGRLSRRPDTSPR